MASASDAGSGVARVEFRVDGTLISSDPNAPYTANWNATSATAGSHTILATAYDAAGNSAASSRSVTVPAPADTTPPVVVLTAPANGSTVTDGSVALTAIASDAGSGVARVEFRVDGALIASDPSAPYAATWNAASATAGGHTILATAYDVAGNSAGSSVTVSVPAPAETYASVYRFYNKINGSYFYTASEAEKDSIVANLSWKYSLEGVAFHISSSFETPLYRFYNKVNGSHFYTASEAEKNSVLANLSATYSYDGVAYDVSATQVSGSTPVYRFYNRIVGSYFYTASEAEKNSVLANLSGTYSLDGVAYYAMP